MAELKNCPFHNCLTCGCYDCVDIPDKQWNTRPIEDALQARIPQWIPVSKPPKESDFYLIRYKGYRVPDTTYYDTEDGWYFEGDSQPDYWMPITELPEENE